MRDTENIEYINLCHTLRLIWITAAAFLIIRVNGNGEEVLQYREVCGFSKPSRPYYEIDGYRTLDKVSDKKGFIYEGMATFHNIFETGCANRNTAACVD
jgi:hypothetical protein